MLEGLLILFRFFAIRFQFIICHDMLMPSHSLQGVVNSISGMFSSLQFLPVINALLFMHVTLALFTFIAIFSSIKYIFY